MGLKRILVFILVIALLGAFSYFFPSIQEMTGDTINQEPADYPKEEAILTKVTDGDTIHALVNGEDVTIRMLGINAPEKNMPLANESRQFLEQFINQTIYLQGDKEDEDKYYRKLRYVFAENGSRNLNIGLLELGFVNSYIFENLIYEKELLRAEAQARNLGIGIWKKSGEECVQCLSLIELNATEEFFVIENICDFDCSLDGWFAKNSGRSSFWLDPMKAGEARNYSSEILNREVWNNDHDSFFIFDETGKLVIYYSY